MGLFFAALGTGVIVFECMLGLRKRYPASPLGRVRTWLSGARVAGAAGVPVDTDALRFPLGRRAGRGADVDVRRDSGERSVRGGAAELHSAADDGTGGARNDVRADPDGDPGAAREADGAGGIRHGGPGDGRRGGGGIRPRRRGEAVLRSGAEEERRGKGAGGSRRSAKRAPQIEMEEGCAARRCGRIMWRRSGRFWRTVRPRIAGDCLLRGRGWRPISRISARSCRWRRTTCCTIWKRSAKSGGNCWCSGACTCGCTAWLLVHVPVSFAFLVLTAAHAVLALRY